MRRTDIRRLLPLVVSHIMVLALPAMAAEPGDIVQGNFRLADKQFPLPRGEWIVAGLGVQPLPSDGVGPFGLIRTAILLQRDGDRVKAVAEFNTNDVPVSDGWSMPAACENTGSDMQFVRYHSRLDVACVLIDQTRISDGPPTWHGALEYIASHHLHVAATMLTTAYLVGDRQDIIDARLHFDPDDLPAGDSARRMLFTWAIGFAPAFDQGMSNQLSGAALEGPLRASLLSDTPMLDRRLLELEALRTAGTITVAEAATQQEAALVERPRSAESEVGAPNGWYYRISTPLINFVTAYGVTQSAPLAVAITLTEHVAHDLIIVANQASWDMATTLATRHPVTWPTIIHLGSIDVLAAAAS